MKSSRKSAHICAKVSYEQMCIGYIRPISFASDQRESRLLISASYTTACSLVTYRASYLVLLMTRFQNTGTVCVMPDWALGACCLLSALVYYYYHHHGAI